MTNKQRNIRIADLEVTILEMKDEGVPSDQRLMKLMEFEDELEELRAERDKEEGQQ